MQVLIRNVSVHVNFDSMNWGPSDLRNRIATAHFLYEALQNTSVTFVPIEGDEVRIIDDDGATCLFTGHISMIERGGDPVGQRYSIDCQDINYLLDKLLYPGITYGAGDTDEFRALNLLGLSPGAGASIPIATDPTLLYYGLGLKGAVSRAKEKNLPALTIAAGTLRSAFDAISAQCGGVAYYIDAARVFHWNDAGIAAPYVLSTRPDKGNPAYSPEVFTDGPVSYWKCDEAGTVITIFDSALAGNSATLVGTSGQAALIANGYSIKATGSTNCPHQAILQPTTAITVEAWVVPSSLTGFAQVIVDKGTYQLRINASNKYEFAVTIGSVATPVATASAVAIASRAPQHVVGTYDGATVALYVDGVLAGSASRTGAIDNNTGVFSIGATQAGASSYAGWLDEIALYATALSAVRVQAHSDAGRARATYYEGYSEFIDRTGHYFRVTAGNGAGVSATATDWVAYGDVAKVVGREVDGRKTVIGHADMISQRIYTAAPVVDSILTTTALAQTRAWVELDKGKARKTIRCSVKRPGLQVGMLVDIVHDTWGTADVTPTPHISREIPAHSTSRGELAIGARGRYLVQKVTPRLLAKGNPNLYRYDVELGDYETDLQTTLARSL